MAVHFRACAIERAHGQRVDADDGQVDQQRALRGQVERQRPAEQRQPGQLAGEEDRGEGHAEPDRQQQQRSGGGCGASGRRGAGMSRCGMSGESPRSARAARVHRQRHAEQASRARSCRGLRGLLIDLDLGAVLLRDLAHDGQSQPAALAYGCRVCGRSARTRGRARPARCPARCPRPPVSPGGAAHRARTRTVTLPPAGV